VIARRSGADIAAYQETARLDPKNGEVHNGLAWLLATGPDGVRDGKQAIEHATRARELTGWKKLNYIDTLAAREVAPPAREVKR
jgi:hypothetical protein